jgi:hypothetical protein
MKIWFDPGDILPGRFCSEQILLTPFMRVEHIKEHPSFIDIEDYRDIISGHVSYSSMDECDYILFPNKLQVGSALEKYVNIACSCGKRLLTFFIDDITEPFKHMPNTIIFRSSMYGSSRMPYEHPMPVWSMDFKKYGEIPHREKKEVPVIGFCGYANHRETDIRKKCLSIIESDRRLKSNFLIRPLFWGGKIDNAELRRQYVNNMVNSDFTLCARGTGNFSYRLYETMSAGRIPVFIDTDCVLPYEHEINYADHFPVISENRISDLGDIVLDFWNNMRDYDSVRDKIRKLYEDYMSPYGFVKQLDGMHI